MKISYIYFIVLLTAILCTPVLTNGQSIHMPRSIVVYQDPGYGLVTQYNVFPKNTLYSICRNYQITLNILEEANPESMLPAINPGDTLVIPFNLNLIDKQIGDGNTTDHIPIYYKTAPKDNLFRIARIYFDQQIDHVMKQNDLNDYNLTPGQLILVGWMHKIGDTPLQIRQEADPGTEENKSPGNDEEQPVFVREIPSDMESEATKGTDSLIISEKDTLQIEQKEQLMHNQNGLAIWNKNSRASGTFALHSEAQVGTLIEVFNPQVNRSSLIKVIGKIPDNSYPDNVKIILSPDAARELGALDARFYVKMKYIMDNNPLEASQ